MHKGAIFDMDGVLVNNLECHVEAFRRLGWEQGAELSGEQMRSVFGRSTVEMFSLMTGREIGAKEGLAIDRRKEELCREISRPKLEDMVVPGLRVLLERFRRESVKMAVATNGPPESVDMILDGLEIRDYFEAVVTGDQVKNGKPDPECFLLAAERMGIPPEECLVFEDSLAGIRAAMASGGRCVALTTTHSRQELAAVEPHVIVRDFEKYMKLIDD